MNDETPRRISVRLGFLAEGKYLCELYTDSKNPLQVNRTEMAVRRGGSLEIDMPAGGGTAARIRKSR